VKDNLRSYRNKSIAIDTSSWMHKSVYSISEKFCETTESGRVDEQCVRVSARYIIARCKELIEGYGIKGIYLVMDGKRCPLKADETQDRENKREQNLIEARRFKRSGQRCKAEEKYKTTIRITKNFTEAVIKDVKNEFNNYSSGFVHVVFSPYEADSMLVKIVLDGLVDAIITEDSDVLVYSAAAHKSFPILFKLDRGTGACDRISMDWLLSASTENATQAVTSNNTTLEGILRRLAVRQTKRKGFGVRLFVQSCILAGSDYSINTLDGIGLIGAFKLVRDNAFRNDAVRFRHILNSLSKKIKHKIDINEYEERLAKSEAVFFYHPVIHTDGTIQTLNPARISSEDNVDDHHFTDHFPFMSRFQGDWSFLGTVSPALDNRGKITSLEPSTSNAIPIWSVNNTESVQKDAPVPVPVPVLSEKRDLLQLSSTQPKILYNPYKNHKPKPLNERNMGAEQNQTKAQKKNQDGGILKYLVKPDLRMARRHLSSSTTRNDSGSKGLKRSRASSSFQISHVSDSKKSKLLSTAANFDDKYASSVGTRFKVDKFDRYHEGHTKDTNDFSYSSSSETDYDIRAHNKQTTTYTGSDNNMLNSSFYDLTKSDSRDFDQSSSFSTCSDNLSERPDTLLIDQTRSRYFASKSDPRRVTLDSSIVCRKSNLSQSTHGDKLNCLGGSSVIERNRWELDECIDDPDEPTSNLPCKSRTKENLKKTNQPIHAFFINQKQELFANQIRRNSRSEPRTSLLNKNPLSQKKKSEVKINTSCSLFFGAGSTKKTNIAFSQLKTNTSHFQSNDDLLWNSSP
jgi:5'-3' exonuclease